MHYVIKELAPEKIYTQTRGVHKSVVQVLVCTRVKKSLLLGLVKGALKIILKAVVPLNKKLSALLDKFYVFMEERFIFSSPDEHA